MSEVMLRLINFLSYLEMCVEIRPKSQGAAYSRVRLINCQTTDRSGLQEVQTEFVKTYLFTVFLMLGPLISSSLIQNF